MRHYFKYILLLTLFCFTTNLQAQFSFKVGYNYSRANTSISNDIIQRFNANNPFLEPLGTIDFLSGFDLGLRLRNEFVGAEISWGNKYNRQFADGINPATNTEEFREIFLRFGSYSLGLESYAGPIGFGATIDLNRVSFRNRDFEDDNKRRVLAETGFSSQFFLSIHFEASETTSFSLRPYVQIPWKGVNLFSLEQELNPEFAATAVDTGDAYTERFTNFGIQVLFFNGN